MLNALRMKSQEIRIVGHHDPAVLPGEGEMPFIRRTDEAGLCGSGHFDPSAPQCIGHGPVHVLVKMKLDRHGRFWRRA
ncbi:MAG: hypothetical protein AMXMBFR13_35060 [Phycisphaerae bacterium]